MNWTEAELESHNIRMAAMKANKRAQSPLIPLQPPENAVRTETASIQLKPISRAVRHAESCQCGIVDENQKPPRKKAVQHEHFMQVAYFDLVRQWEGKYPMLKMVFAVPNRQASRASIAFMRQEGLRSGIPDILVGVPREEQMFSGLDRRPVGILRMCGLAIELKHGNGRTSLNQKTMHESFSAAGWRVITYFDAFEAWNETVWYLRLPDDLKVEPQGIRK